MDYPGKPNVITKVLLKGRQEGQVRKEKVMMEREGRMVHFEGGGRGYKPRNAQYLQKLDTDSLLESPKGMEHR